MLKANNNNKSDKPQKKKRHEVPDRDDEITVCVDPAQSPEGHAINACATNAPMHQAAKG